MSSREEKKATRRRAILQKARNIFLENGYAATTMSQVATEIGGSKGTLWSYFPTKEDLFTATIEDASMSFRIEIEESLNHKGKLSDNLRSFAVMFIEKVSTRDSIQLQRIIIGESARFPEIGRIFYERAFQPVHSRLAQYLEDQSGLGTIQVDDPAHAAHEFLALIQRPQTFLLWGVVGAGKMESMFEYVSRAVDTFIKRYAGPCDAKDWK